MSMPNWLDVEDASRGIAKKYGITGHDERIQEACLEQAYQLGRKSMMLDDAQKITQERAAIIVLTLLKKALPAGKANRLLCALIK